MDLDNQPLEEGEIFEDTTYRPLERPANYSAAPNRFSKIESESEGELETTSASDSDSDTEVFVAKKPKVSLKAPTRTDHSKRKKYDIWSSRVHEDLLSETLVSCNVTQRDMSRNVESYDYTLSENYKYNKREHDDHASGRSVKDRLGRNDYERGVKDRLGRSDYDRGTTERSSRDRQSKESNIKERSSRDRQSKVPNIKERLGYHTKGKVESRQRDRSDSNNRDKCEERSRERTSNKRRFNERSDKKLKLVQKKEEKGEKGSARYLLDLNVDSKSTDKELAVELANKLFEEKEELIEKVVSVMGQEKVKQIYKEVKRIEADGGMFLMNQMRRRTPGGVFLFLVRHDSEITKEQNDMIFEADRQNYKQYLKSKKKERLQQIKARIAAQKTANLPELLTKADLVEKLNSENWSAKESDQDDVTNPPPTPETDGHADSGDGLDASEQLVHQPINNSYENDFLDISAGNDMDLF